MRHNPSMDAWVTVVAGDSALVLDSPHSGTLYPADFGYVCPQDILRRAEDTHVERLYAFAPALGAAWIEARFARSYLDVNRHPDNIDAALLDAPWPHPLPAPVGDKIRLGKGLIWRLTDDGVAIYQRHLTVREVRARISRCWQPYHAALAQAVAGALARHGGCIHINCHSMPSVAASHATAWPGQAHPDFVVGDRDGSSAAPALSQRVCDLLVARGYRVAYNHPYKGVECVRRHGDPARHCHSLQLEINRRLYMDEATLRPHSGFASLQQDLHALLQRLRQLDPRDF